MTQIKTGLNVANKTLQAYRDVNTRLKRIVQNYDATDKLGYLRNISALLSIN